MTDPQNTSKKIQKVINEHKCCYIDAEKSDDVKEKTEKRLKCNKKLVNEVKDIIKKTSD